MADNRPVFIVRGVKVYPDGTPVTAEAPKPAPKPEADTEPKPARRTAAKD